MEEWIWREEMADFCWDCWDEMGFPGDRRDNDLYGICEPDHILRALCEGCGEGFFDHEGKKVFRRVRNRGLDRYDWDEGYPFDLVGRLP